MHVFHIKGISGLMSFLVALLMMVVLAFVVPTSFMMVLWNALVFEGMNGPEIGMSQGFVLWMMVLVVFKLVFKPEIQLQLRNVGDMDSLKGAKKPDQKED